MKKEKGFTLVELLIVVAIIGILAAIAIPQFNKYKIRGYLAALRSDLKNAHTSGSAYLTDYPNLTITLTTQLVRGGWKGSDKVVATEAKCDMGTSAGRLTLKSSNVNNTNVSYPGAIPVVAGATFNAAATGTDAEGQIAFEGTTFIPIVQ